MIAVAVMTVVLILTYVIDLLSDIFVRPKDTSNAFGWDTLAFAATVGWIVVFIMKWDTL